MISHQRAIPGNCARLQFRHGTAARVPKLGLTVGLAAAFVVAACDIGPTTLDSGFLKVTIATLGGDLDEDGYELIAAEETRPVAPQSSVFLAVRPGTHVLELKGLAGNCSVVGTNPRSIVVERRGSTSEAFEVRCDPTGILVETTTIGPDLPALGYVAVIGMQSSYVGPNGSTVISRLAPSSHTVSLSRVADNCSVANDSARTVVVEHRKLARVAFAVTCTTTDARIALVLDSLDNGAFVNWIAIADAGGRGVATPLVRGHSPAWSLDRTKLAYSNLTCYPDYYYLMTACFGGLVLRDVVTGIESVPEAGRKGRDPSWSPDGRHIAFVRDSSAWGDAKLHLMDLEGGDLQPDMPGVIEANGPSWSPDGKRLVFHCRLGVNYDLCVINSDGSSFVQLQSKPVIRSSLEWSPDGSRIAFTTLRTVGSSAQDTYLPAIGLIAPDGTGLTLLTDGMDPSWSPDGSKLVFARADGLFTVNADGSGVARITTGQHRAPRWRR